MICIFNNKRSELCWRVTLEPGASYEFTIPWPVIFRISGGMNSHIAFSRSEILLERFLLLVIEACLSERKRVRRGPAREDRA